MNRLPHRENPWASRNAGMTPGLPMGETTVAMPAPASTLIWAAASRPAGCCARRGVTRRMVARPTSAATSWRICRTASPIPVTVPLPRTRILVIGNRPIGYRLVLRRIQSSTREGRLGQVGKGRGRFLGGLLDLTLGHGTGDLDAETVGVVGPLATARRRLGPSRQLAGSLGWSVSRYGMRLCAAP